MVLGESTSYGLLLENRTRDAYPFQVTRYLNKKHNDIDFSLINLSYPGQISESILRAFRRSYLKHKPDLVICHFGINDMNMALNPFLQARLLGFTIPSFFLKVKTIKLTLLSYFFYRYTENIKKGERAYGHTQLLSITHDNYQSIIDILKKSQTSYIMLSYFDGPPALSKLFSELQRENQAHYIDLDLDPKENDKKEDLFAGDGWHPSAKGHTLIAQKIINLLNSKPHYFLNLN